MKKLADIEFSLYYYSQISFSAIVIVSTDFFFSGAGSRLFSYGERLAVLGEKCRLAASVCRVRFLRIVVIFDSLEARCHEKFAL